MEVLNTLSLKKMLVEIGHYRPTRDNTFSSTLFLPTGYDLELLG